MIQVRHRLPLVAAVAAVGVASVLLVAAQAARADGRILRKRLRAGDFRPARTDRVRRQARGNADRKSRFPAKEAVYPVALTAAGGQPLDLVLYVFAASRVEPSAAMHLAYAGPSANPLDFLLM